MMPYYQMGYPAQGYMYAMPTHQPMMMQPQGGPDMMGPGMMQHAAMMGPGGGQGAMRGSGGYMGSGFGGGGGGGGRRGGGRGRGGGGGHEG